MKRFCFSILSLFFFLSVPSFAQSTIFGEATSFKGETIALYKYSDFITNPTELLASAEVDSNGAFQLPSKADYTYRGTLTIGNLKAHLYVEPNTTYHIVVPLKDSIDYTDSSIPLDFKNRDSTELNALISDYNYHHDMILSNNYVLFLKHGAKALVDSFTIEMKHRYANVKNEYFSTYMNYSIAVLEQSNRASKKDLFNHYINSSPIQYQHDAYMDFFNQFYTKYFIQLAYAKYGEEIIDAVNKKISYGKLMELLAQDSYLKDERVRDLILIKGLYEANNDDTFEKKSIRFLLRTIANESSYPEHKAIANNALKKLSKMAEGSKAPPFELLNQDGESIKLSDFKGKYIYLDFWATWCIPCLQEMQLMPPLIEKYGKDIAFVSISIDKEFDAMKKFLAKTKNVPEKVRPDWTFLHYGTDPAIMEQYEMVAIPTYILIDPEGNIKKAPAERPTEDIEKVFREILKR